MLLLFKNIKLQTGLLTKKTAPAHPENFQVITFSSIHIHSQLLVDIFIIYLIT